MLEWLRGLTLTKKQVLGTAMREVLQELGIDVCGTEFGRQLGQGQFEFRLRQKAGDVRRQKGKGKRLPPESILLRVFCHAFGDRMREVEAASDAAGEAEALRAYGEHFQLARQVIQLRQKAGWTQQQLAKVSGIQQSEISRIERGQGNPTFRTLHALAHSGKMTVSFVSERRVRERPARQSAAKRSGQRLR